MRPQILIFLVVGLIAASQSGNIVRLGAAHPVAIAAWRLLLAAAVLAPLAAPHRAMLARLTWRERGLLLLTGGVLAAHFITWIAAIQMTTVASAASLLAVAPVIAAIGGALLFGERYGLRFAASLLFGAAGVVVISAGDAGSGGEQLAGDLTAVLCAALFACYLLLGRRLRSAIPNALYVVLVYGAAAVICLVALIALRLPLIAYDARTWLCFVLMALVPTVIGHTSLNSALRYLDAGRVAVAVLAEPPLAALVAWLAWGESLRSETGVGFALITLSLILLTVERRVAPTTFEKPGRHA